MRAKGQRSDKARDETLWGLDPRCWLTVFRWSAPELDTASAGDALSVWAFFQHPVGQHAEGRRRDS